MIEKFVFKALLCSLVLFLVNWVIMGRSLARLGKEGSSNPKLRDRVILVGVLLGILGCIIPLLLSLELIMLLINALNFPNKLKFALITIYTTVYLVAFLIKLVKFKKKKDIKK